MEKVVQTISNEINSVANIKIVRPYTNSSNEIISSYTISTQSDDDFREYFPYNNKDLYLNYDWSTNPFNLVKLDFPEYKIAESDSSSKTIITNDGILAIFDFSKHKVIIYDLLKYNDTFWENIEPDVGTLKQKTTNPITNQNIMRDSYHKGSFNRDYHLFSIFKFRDEPNITSFHFIQISTEDDGLFQLDCDRLARYEKDEATGYFIGKPQGPITEIYLVKKPVYNYNTFGKKIEGNDADFKIKKVDVGEYCCFSIENNNLNLSEMCSLEIW